MNYTRLGKDGLEARLEAGAGEVIFRATNIRQERTGVHAQVEIGTADGPLADDTFNVGRDADRTKLVNKFYKRLEGKFTKQAVVALNEAYEQVHLELDFVVFCNGLWAALLGDDSGQEVAGDEHPSAPPWAVPGLVMEGATGMWVGDAGGNKSTLMRLTAQSLRYGVATVIPVKSQANVIWVNAEEPPDEHKRQMGNVNKALDLDRTSDIYTIDARGLSIQDLAPRVEAAMQSEQAKHIFVDSLSRLARGMNLNENATATLLIDSLAGVDASVTWIGHTGHENRQRMAGSKHFENAGRVMILIQSRISDHPRAPELTRGVRARVYKANGAVPTEPMYWKFEYHAQYGLAEAAMADKADWPLLHCDAPSGNDVCGRRTWDGVTRAGVRCSRHQQDEEE